jgi:hypothetical protein
LLILPTPYSAIRFSDEPGYTRRAPGTALPPTREVLCLCDA